jgi:hypothetical protein
VWRPDAPLVLCHSPARRSGIRFAFEHREAFNVELLQLRTPMPCSSNPRRPCAEGSCRAERHPADVSGASLRWSSRTQTSPPKTQRWPVGSAWAPTGWCAATLSMHGAVSREAHPRWHSPIASIRSISWCCRAGLNHPRPSETSSGLAVLGRHEPVHGSRRPPQLPRG